MGACRDYVCALTRIHICIYTHMYKHEVGLLLASLAFLTGISPTETQEFPNKHSGFKAPTLEATFGDIYHVLL